MKSQLRTVPLSECNSTLVTFNRAQHSDRDHGIGITANKYCAYDPSLNGEMCQEATGGPLQKFPNNTSIAIVLGIASYNTACGTTTSNVYTRVASYLDWIEPIVWPHGL